MICNQKEKNITEELVVFHCAPTMAGLKTGSLFNCPLEDKTVLLSTIRWMNKCLVPYGVRLVPLKIREQSALIYMYRPQKLNMDLKHEITKEILLEKDYPIIQTEKCIVELIRRINQQETFPHEIGLFLGYPPEDVDAFIKNEATNAKYSGMWKVYGDVKKAKGKFKQYKKCSQLYWEAFQKHHSFEKLIVKCS